MAKVDLEVDQLHGFFEKKSTSSELNEELGPENVKFKKVKRFDACVNEHTHNIMLLSLKVTTPHFSHFIFYYASNFTSYRAAIVKNEIVRNEW